MSPLLFEPLQVGAMEIPNRVIMAPLTRCRADQGRVPNDLMHDYYVQRASAGFILSEATSVSPMGVGYPDTPGIWSRAQTEGWKRITEAVHEVGGRILLQLWHVGRISHPMYLNGELPVAPSAIAPAGHVSLTRPKQPYPVPRALETGELPGIIEEYRKGAQNAQEAGFDGVELHGANGYLLDQFLQTSSNQRDDDYGGSVENRARLMLQATDAALDVWSASRVGMHLSTRGDSHDVGDADPAATFGYVARELGKRGLAFICAREGLQGEKRFGPDLKRAFQEAGGGAYIANEGFTREAALRVLAAGEADAIAFGREFIANPDLPHRLQIDAPLNTPDTSTFYAAGAHGYTDYPTLQNAEPELAMAH